MPNTSLYPGWPEEREAAWAAIRETWEITHDDLPLGIRQTIERLIVERDELRTRFVACQDHLNAARNYAYDSRSDRDECDVLLRAIAQLDDGRKGTR